MLSASTANAASSRHPRLQRFALEIGLTAVFNVVIALIITYVMRIHPVFMDNLVVSMCIGTIGVFIASSGRLLLWGLGQPPLLPFLALMAAAVLLAFGVGHTLAHRLINKPMATFEMQATSTASITILASFIITWFFWTRGKLEHLKAQAAAIEKQAIQAQLSSLQSQIEPHMLFNTLANLQALIAMDPERAQKMLAQLIDYLRVTLQSSRLPQMTLQQEFAVLDAYLGLMQVRMGERLAYTLQLPDSLQELVVPPLLLQPLVENAIKHGLEPKIEGGQIIVTAGRTDDMLVLRVTDTGLGLAGDTGTSGMRVGLANLRERLKALYGNRATFALEANTPCGAISTVRIPL